MGTVAYDPANGEVIWKVITDGMNQASRPILKDDLIFVTAGSASTLFAVKTGGTGDITKSHVAYTKTKIAPGKPSPLAVGDAMYWVTDTGVVYCTALKTGKEKWKESLGDKFAASPVYANGMIYLASEAGHVFVIMPGESYELMSKNKLDGPIRASPAAVGNDLFVRTYTHLYCFAK